MHNLKRTMKHGIAQNLTKHYYNLNQVKKDRGNKVFISGRHNFSRNIIELFNFLRSSLHNDIQTPPLFEVPSLHIYLIRQHTPFMRRQRRARLTRGVILSPA